VRRACGASQFDSERHRARIWSARISIETRTIADGANRDLRFPSVLRWGEGSTSARAIQASIVSARSGASSTLTPRCRTVLSLDDGALLSVVVSPPA
jgi:hypothetical protein